MKNTAGLKDRKCLGGGCLNRMVKDGLSDEMMFELLSESSAEASHKSIWRVFLADRVASVKALGENKHFALKRAL